MKTKKPDIFEMLARIDDRVYDDNAFTSAEMMAALAKDGRILDKATVRRTIRKNVRAGIWEQVWKRYGNPMRPTQAYRPVKK